MTPTLSQANPHPCFTCKGRGFIPNHRYRKHTLEIAKECPSCNGTGLRPRTPLLLVDPPAAYDPSPR